MGGYRGERGGYKGSESPIENHKLLYVSLKILVQTLLQKQLDPLGPIASWERSLQPSVKYVEDCKIIVRIPSPEEFCGSAQWHVVINFYENFIFDSIC